MSVVLDIHTCYYRSRMETWMSSALPALGRRSQIWFPITARAKYIYRSRQVETVTDVISSKVIVLVSQEMLPEGQRLRVYVEWRAKLDGHIPLALFVRGKILWSNGQTFGVLMLTHEFRLHKFPMKWVARSGERDWGPVTLNG